MRKLIYQVNIPIRGKSVLYDFCNESVQNYCKKHDIDYYMQTEPILKIGPDTSRTNRNMNGLIKEAGGYMVIFEKENALDYLQFYDQVAVIDSDIYIKQDAPDIFEELPAEFDFGGVYERDLPLTDGHRRKIQGYSRDMFDPLDDVDWDWQDGIAGFMNMGLMVMNKSLKEYMHGQTPEELIRRPEFKDLVDGINYWRYSTDQVLLNYWLRKEKAKVKALDWKWNAMYRGTDDMSNANFIHFFLKDHLPNKGEDLSMLKEIVNK